MNKFFLWLSIALQFIGTSLQAQSQNSTGKSLLWKISGKNLAKPSYLFGTMHSICAEDYFFEKHMENALAAADKLLLEIDMSDPMAMLSYQQQLMLPQGESIRDYFQDEDAYTRFGEFVKKNLGMDIAMMTQFKPFMFVSMLSMKAMQCSTQESYETNLMSKAKTQQKSIGGLETIKDQLDIFDQMSKSELKQMLLQTMEQMSETDTTLRTMTSLYKTQDVEALHRFIVSFEDMYSMESKLISSRNLRWMNQLQHDMPHESLFIAVGAGHLGGEQGLIKLLRRGGYTVEPIVK